MNLQDASALGHPLCGAQRRGIKSP